MPNMRRRQPWRLSANAPWPEGRTRLHQAALRRSTAQASCAGNSPRWAGRNECPAIPGFRRQVMIPIYPDHSPKLKHIDDYLVEDEARGDYRLHRSAFTDEALFELEMRHIFEGNWIYLAHESQIPNNNDYYTTYMGRQPIVIARNRQGELNAFI